MTMSTTATGAGYSAQPPVNGSVVVPINAASAGPQTSRGTWIQLSPEIIRVAEGISQGLSLSDSERSNSGLNSRRPQVNAPHTRISLCRKITNIFLLSVVMPVKTFINVAGSGAVSLAVGSSLLAKWNDPSNRSDPSNTSRATVVAVELAIATGATILLAPTLGRIIYPTASQRCASAISLALGVLPLMIFSAEVYSSTQTERLNNFAIIAATTGITATLSSVFRDFGTHFTKPLIVGLDIASVSTGQVLASDHEQRQFVDKWGTRITVLLYTALSFLYYAKETNFTNKILLDLKFDTKPNDADDFYSRCIKIFMLGLPPVLLRGLVEAVDDLLIATVKASLISAKGANIIVKPANYLKFKENLCSPFDNIIKPGIEGAGLRTLFKALFSISTIFFKGFPIGKEINPGFKSYETWLKAGLGGLSETRGHFVDKGTLEYALHRSGNPISADFKSSIRRLGIPRDERKAMRDAYSRVLHDMKLSTTLTTATALAVPAAPAAPVALAVPVAPVAPAVPAVPVAPAAPAATTTAAAPPRSQVNDPSQVLVSKPVIWHQFPVGPIPPRS